MALDQLLEPDTQATHLSIGRRFASEALGKADMAVFDELVDPDIVVTTGLSPREPVRGRAAYKAILTEFAEAWPVTHFTIDDLFAAGDRVVVCFTAIAVFRKDYYGVKATHVIAPLKEIQLCTIRNGKIVENIVGAINLPYEFTMYRALKDAVLGGLETAARSRPRPNACPQIHRALPCTIAPFSWSSLCSVGLGSRRP